MGKKGRRVVWNEPSGQYLGNLADKESDARQLEPDSESLQLNCQY